MRRTWLVAGAAVAVAVLGACSPSDTDFKEAAEETIESNADALGQEFSDATCDTPGNTDVGTTFSCTATGADGSVWDFEAEITGDNEVTVSPVGPQG